MNEPIYKVSKCVPKRGSAVLCVGRLCGKRLSWYRATWNGEQFMSVPGAWPVSDVTHFMYLLDLPEAEDEAEAALATAN